VIEVILEKIQQALSFKKKNLITVTNSDSVLSDEFRKIQTNIQFLSEGKENQVYLMTAPGRREGTSTITANSAVMMAEQKGKTLLIDANLRDPAIHRMFELMNQVGLADVLVGNATIKQAIQPTEISNLDVITSGLASANPTELLGSEKMADLLKSVKDNYNMVLIDAPTLLKTTETRMLATRCDGVILILNRGKTGIDKTVEARKTLEFAQAKLVGTILNDK